MSALTKYLVPLAAMFLAAVMGYAIQRGGTCTVAAVDEILTKRKASRFLALTEAAVWVLGGLLLGNMLGLTGLMPSGYRLSAWTMLGAALLGLGAALNQSCVFGTLARLGNGEWAYVATPVGFFCGCWLTQWAALGVKPVRLTNPSPVLMAPVLIAVLIAAWMLWRMLGPSVPRFVKGSVGAQMRNRQAGIIPAIGQKIWAPHAATLVIGVTFVLLLWLVGPWTYTELLADWARTGMASMLARVGFVLALFLGAVAGGWTAGRIRWVPLRGMAVLRCAMGGLLMGVGSCSIPGGNDGLILTGMPLLWPHAWVSFITMCTAIAGFLLAQSSFEKWRRTR